MSVMWFFCFSTFVLIVIILVVRSWWNYIFILVTSGQKMLTPTTTNQQHNDVFLYIWKTTFYIFKMDFFQTYPQPNP
jgi:hypothetical protein